MLKARPVRASKKAPTKSRRVGARLGPMMQKKASVKSRRTTTPGIKPDHVIALSAADSRKLADYLSAPACEPTETMKDALAAYRRLVQG